MKNPDFEFWHGKRVFVTGHTGFKGGWLSLWLHMLGAIVHGYALAPPTTPSFFEACDLATLFHTDVRGDLADLPRLRKTIAETQPEVVFHLAAQPLVRESYADPVQTFMTNTMGTAHLLDVCRSCKALQCVVLITTDKVYTNREWEYPYRENDRLGGRDPYSASKAAAELVADSFRRSYFSAGREAVRVATARAGNVVGGGDWAEDRLVPDCMRAFFGREPVVLRNPGSIRPWQHVLEPLLGYLLLAEKLCLPDGERFARAFNFGPNAAGHVSVEFVARELARRCGEHVLIEIDDNAMQPHEAGLLRLETSLARLLLEWHPRWSVGDALSKTLRWHKDWIAGKHIRQTSMNQIDQYCRDPECGSLPDGGTP